MSSYFIYSLISVFYLFTAFTIGEKLQNFEETFCTKYNIGPITWSCKRTADCEWSHNILGTVNEHRCSKANGGKICCPSRRSKSPGYSDRNSTRSPITTSTVSPLQKTYVEVARKKCAEYAKARYVLNCVGSPLAEGEPICEEELNCVKYHNLLLPTEHEAEETEFPHMALVGHGSKEDDITWSCDGSLISDRFILSSAHCTNEGTTSHIKWAALGVIFREQATAEKLNANVFEIVRTLNHPQYKKSMSNHDIALYELERPVKLSSFIRPICLPTENTIPTQQTSNVIVNGWFANVTSDSGTTQLQKMSVDILPNISCIRNHIADRRLKRGFQAESMVCVDYFEDVCLKQPGGPLLVRQKDECMYTQIGVVSLDNSNCGYGSPPIYTRVFAYLDWIGKIVWPNEI